MPAADRARRPTARLREGRTLGVLGVGDRSAYGKQPSACCLLSLSNDANKGPRAGVATDPSLSSEWHSDADERTTSCRAWELQIAHFFHSEEVISPACVAGALTDARRGSLGCMARQPRIEFEGALHHVMSRGNDGIVIFRDDVDRTRFLTLLAEEIARSRWTLHDYCLMSNHYHLAISTGECTLSTGMHRLLARYAQFFNRRHGRRGHLFQERFKSVLVEEETHGIVLSRYLALNPVRAGMCARPQDWAWSSYAARAGLAPAPEWLTLEPLASQFGLTVETQQRAFREFVLSAVGVEREAEEATAPALLRGSASWVQRVQQMLDERDRSQDHPRAQVHPGRPDLDAVMNAVAQTFDTTSNSIVSGRGTLERRVVAFLAFEEGLVPLRRIAQALGLRSASHVSSLVRRCRGELLDETMRTIVEACRNRMERRLPPFLLAREITHQFARSYHRALPRYTR